MYLLNQALLILRMEIEEKLNQSEVHFQLLPIKEHSLEELKITLLASIAKFFENYIWNSEPITISIQNGLLYGILEFGDLYEEEWLVVKFLIGT